MNAFQWGQHFVTDLAEVDDQHHRLVDIINQFGELLSKGEVDFDDIERVFNELSAYSVYHFEEEEQLMLQSGVDFRHFNRHADIHKRFLAEVSSLYAAISPDNYQQANSFLKFLVHWLAYHILGIDQDMALQIKAIKSGMSPSDAFDMLEQERASATAPLVSALNGLFELVTMRNQELKQLNESLEEKVEQRTLELSKLNQHLEEISLSDVLTGLPNRRHAMRCLENLWDESIQHHLPLSCLMIDADHFKQVNDTYGHDAGDLVLVELAKTLQGQLRNDDLVCRLGGDEFLVLLPNTALAAGLNLAEALLKKVQALRIETGGEPWHGSISIGLASISPSMNGYEALIKAADTALYAAKAAGKNCVRAIEK